MPHIRIRSMTDAQVQALSQTLPAELSRVLNTPEDNFTVELVATTFFKDGKLTQADPMVEVLWFDRGQEVKTACAQKITELVRKVSTADYIAVVFTEIPTTSYYENGKHF